MSGLKESKYLWSWDVMKDPHPRMIEIDLTNKCNLNCSFCISKEIVNKKPFHELTFDGPNHRTREELDLIRNDPGVDGFVLYETSNYTRINKEGRLKGSSDIANLINTHFFQ